MRALYWIIPLLAILAFACELEPFTFKMGEDLVAGTTEVVLVDTLSVNLSTYKKDSIVTSGKGGILAGIYQDELFGDIAVSSYFQFALPDDGISVEIDEICDSVSLLLSYTDNIIGDTLGEQSYEVYRLIEELEEDDDGGIYQLSEFEHEPDPVGSLRFFPRPERDGALEIMLDKAFGEELLLYIQENESDLNDDDFLDLFKGFVIKPGESACHSVLSFAASDTSAFLKLYSHEPGPFPIGVERLFPLINDDLQFNHISYDLIEIPAFDSISEETGIPAVLSNGISCIQGGTGLYSRISFPSLEDVTGRAEMNNSILISALLYLDPVDLDYSRTEILDDLLIYETASNGDLGDVILNASGYQMTPSQYLDEIYHDNSFLVFDLTSFIEEEVADYYVDPEFGFYLSFSSTVMATKLDRIMLDGSADPRNKMKLVLTFFHYDL